MTEHKPKQKKNHPYSNICYSHDLVDIAAYTHTHPDPTIKTDVYTHTHWLVDGMEYIQNSRLRLCLQNIRFVIVQWTFVENGSCVGTFNLYLHRSLTYRDLFPAPHFGSFYARSPNIYYYAWSYKNFFQLCVSSIILDHFTIHDYVPIIEYHTLRA